MDAKFCVIDLPFTYSGVGQLNGFYLGLYGGSELPGTLDSSKPAQQLFLGAGYQEIDRTIVLHRETATFRPRSPWFF